jgi:hypothetical protein
MVKHKLEIVTVISTIVIINHILINSICVIKGKYNGLIRSTYLYLLTISSTTRENEYE